MVTNKEIAIPFSKGKIALLLLCAALFIAISLHLFCHPEDFKRRNPIITKAVGFIGIPFSFLSLVFALTKLFDKRPGLIIDEEGFVNNTSFLKNQRIQWTNVTGLDIWKYNGSKMILVYVNNPEEIIASANKFYRFWLRLNARKHGTPVWITSITLKISFNELLEIIKQQNRPGFSLQTETPQ